MGATVTGRGNLIKQLWPDKAMYGSIMLAVTGLLGVLFGLLLLIIGEDQTRGWGVPAFLRDYPPEATIALSVATVVLAYIALRRHNAVLAIVGCVTGLASLGALGLGSFLSLVALAFVALSIREKEHENPATATLSAEMWPDKSLAASMFLFVAGIITLGFGAAIAFGLLTFFEDSPGFSLWFGIFDMVVGLLCGYAAWLLYHQRGVVWGLVAGIAAIVGVGAYLLAPLLGLVALALLFLAWREREFEGAEPE